MKNLAEAIFYCISLASSSYGLIQNQTVYNHPVFAPIIRQDPLNPDLRLIVDLIHGRSIAGKFGQII